MERADLVLASLRSNAYRYMLKLTPHSNSPSAPDVSWRRGRRAGRASIPRPIDREIRMRSVNRYRSETAPGAVFVRLYHFSERQRNAERESGTGGVRPALPAGDVVLSRVENQ
ncbi:hypothetical protein EVAR_4798_1 [Eumeta japonica]|uniref:Uncharacterized protein n=1 Tax=Eumeta variegata TaxID=151549 RepID=A0A4C1SZ00_EUMVA|nr:hypothetical protein EVAR_4798_1 [Eumeta japonica]